MSGRVDYTGSTDVLEVLSRHGVRTALFLEPLGSDNLTGRFADLQAIGVAEESRSMTSAEVDEHLRETFKAIEELDPTLFQYKVCSTFDSDRIGGASATRSISARMFSTRHSNRAPRMIRGNFDRVSSSLTSTRISES
ncbi:four-carbon acid sugar kinase family protein [Halegenticoccus tardaugens]|uniref:four-carbon acid sugar kinase family protein n=1 Tax=Halegenticoccus tardaugens TaxID=2071624 RepID=UPI00374496BF